jgi:hypothetical protein
MAGEKYEEEGVLNTALSSYKFSILIALKMSFTQINRMINTGHHFINVKRSSLSPSIIFKKNK